MMRLLANILTTILGLMYEKPKPKKLKQPAQIIQFPKKGVRRGRT